MEIKHLAITLLFLPIAFLIVGCGNSDENDPEVITPEPEPEPKGSKLTIIDGHNFYLDHVKYTVAIESLNVTGYDPKGFDGVANIASQVTFNGYPYKVQTIFYEAFKDCKELTSVNIAEGVATIGQKAFSGCTALSSVSIPSSVKDIGFEAFQGCTGLTTLNIPEGTATIGASAFSGCTTLSSITLPQSLTYIDNGAFAKCSALTTVTIPPAVSIIHNGTFNGCTNLTSVTFGKGLSIIFPWAFNDCVNLKDVYCPIVNADDISAQEESFGDYVSATTLHVPAASIADYQKQSPWNKFASIVAL